MNKLLKAVNEASISVAELRKDIENIQNQITIIENYLEPFVVEELDAMKEDT